MPEKSSKRKARRYSPTNLLDEPEAASLRTENVPSVSDKDFSEISEKVEKSVSRRKQEIETNRSDSKIDKKTYLPKSTHYLVKHLGLLFRKRTKPFLKTWF